MIATVEPWIEPPLARFVREARVTLALLLEPSGRVVAQHGFTRSMDVMSACALVAAIQATSAALGRLVDGHPFGGLHHPGRERQLYVAEAGTPHARYILLAVFDDVSSLGLVQHFAGELRLALAAAAPTRATASPLPAAEDFERDLNRSLRTLFGRVG